MEKKSTQKKPYKTNKVDQNKDLINSIVINDDKSLFSLGRQHGLRGGLHGKTASLLALIICDNIDMLAIIDNSSWLLYVWNGKFWQFTDINRLVYNWLVDNGYGVVNITNNLLGEIVRELKIKVRRILWQ